MPAPAPAADENARASGYAWYVLGVLFLVYCLNFIDRQILSILAEDLKRDLGLSDQDLGFLYGTAFGVFYALFGIPLGRLADHWRRVKLLSIGLTLWSMMTTLSGFARSGTTLSFARIGVGVGEATASPAAYSLISDWFPARQPATALAIYSAGLFVGSGISLGIGGLIVRAWNNAYPHGGPMGLVGWQAAFLAVGLPGLLLAAVVATLREPSSHELHGRVPGSPLRTFLLDLSAILPPFTLIDAARRGAGAFAVNLAAALGIALAVAALVWSGEPVPQWLAIGCGVYALVSWATSLRRRDPAAFGLIVANPAMIFTIVAYGLNTFLSYSVSFWAAPYAIRLIGVDAATAGLFLGGCNAASGFLGVTLGGIVADRLRLRHSAGRLWVVIFGAAAQAPFVWLGFSSTSLLTLCIATFCSGGFAATALGAGGATIQDLVPSRMRGTATAAFFIGTTLLGLALGPYLAGRISTVTGDLSFAMKCLTASSPIAVLAGALAWRFLAGSTAARLRVEAMERNADTQ